MDEQLDFIMLTKSYKNGHYCVAGINVANGSLVRLVSDDVKSNGAIFDWHMNCEDGSACEVMDRVSVPILGAHASQYQPENILIDKYKPWEIIGKADSSFVMDLHPPENESKLLGSFSSKVTSEEISELGKSLSLIFVDSVCLSKRPSDNKCMASFTYQNHAYNLRVTDPIIVTMMKDQSSMERLKNALLVVSLRDTPFDVDNCYYKLVAMIRTVVTC